MGAGEGSGGADAKLFLNPVESAERSRNATFPFTHGAASRRQFSFFIAFFFNYILFGFFSKILFGSLTAHFRLGYLLGFLWPI